MALTTRSRRLQFAWLVALPLALAACATAADEDWEDEEYVELPLGLEAIYQAADATDVLHRMEPAPRLYGGDHDAPHPKLPADFRVTWRGRLLVPYDAEYTFSLLASSLGELSLTLRGRSVGLGEPVELEFGNVPFALSGVHGGGPPRLELAWETEFFDREVIAARFFGHEPVVADSPEIAQQALEDSGAALAESFGCFRCHRGPEAWLKSLTADLKPEVFLPGPLLRGAERRVHRSWLEDYLADPAAYRPGTRMPAQLAADGSDRTALETIVAYLTSGQTSVWAEARPTGSAEAGENVYEACGCAACHEPPEAAVAATGVLLRIPSLDRLAEKWTAPGLVSFLETPLTTRPHGRMPDFALAETEGRDLAAYLLDREGAGEAREFVALPPPKEPVTSDARNLVDPKGQMLVMGLDEGSGELADRSGQENHGRAVGTVAYGREGQSGGALGFDGQGGHVIVGDTTSFNMNKAFTWSAWIKTTGSGSILARAPETGNWVWGGKTLFVRDGKLAFDVGWTGVLTSETAVADGRWHHVAVTTEFQTDKGFDTVRLYIDGREDVVRTDWNINRYPEENFVLKLGMASVNFPQEETFNGLVDDVAVWSRTLDPEEIAALAEGKSHLALTEASLYASGDLKTQWTGLGEDPAQFDRLPAGLRLKAVALRQMGRYGCLGCHDVGAQSLLKIRRRPHGAPQLTMTSRPPIARPFARLSGEPSERGCLSDAPGRGAAPRFDFSDDERSALAAYVASLARRGADSLAESAAVDLKLLNCTACHENEGYGGEPLTALLGGEEAAQFIRPPSLSAVAVRLRPERLDEFLREGNRLRRMRPWVGGKMPGFGQRGGRLARDLAMRDSVSPPPPPGKPVEEDRPAVPQNQVEIGRLLVSDKGLTCLNCHAMNGRQPSGEVDPSTRSPDLGVLSAHVRRDYYIRLLRNPERIFLGTKMPVIFPKNGPPPVASLKELPEETLLEALWNYLSLGPDAPSPLEDRPAELLPSMLRVHVQRGPTFVGERLFGRGISCGFPTGTLLYDADGLQPAAIWFDGFLFRVPTNYFGLNWRAPAEHELFPGDGHRLAFQPGEGKSWQAAPLPLECDPNTASRFDGYTVGRSDVAFHYRLRFDGCRVRVSNRVRLERRGAWRGFLGELSIDGLPDGSRIAWTLPPGEKRRFYSAAGAEVDGPADPESAPVAVWRSDGRARAIQVGAESGAAWEIDAAGEKLRFAGPRVAGGKTVRLEIGRWTHAENDHEPSADELASLCAPGPLEPATVEPKPASGEEHAAAAGSDGVEEPFTYKLDYLPSPPEGWRPSGTAFTSDGRIYAVGMTEGRVYRAMIPPARVPDDFRWELYASGLNIPTGMNVIDDRLFVAHRPEVTELVDGDGDGLVETFRTLMGPWSLKDGFHEYAFGLAVDLEKRPYVALNNGYFWSYGGPTTRGRHRSAVVRCDLEGRSEEWGRGCRVPNGICRGPEGQVFFADNQGDWIQVNKIVHCRKGLFYGHPETEDEFPPEGEAPSGLPAVWLPYNVIRSAAALCFDHTEGKFGPFAEQMFVGDVGYGQSLNIMRVALEKVDGVWQGAAFRYLDTEPRGPQHAAFGPDGHLYISCLTDGVVRIRWGGKTPMEIHRVALRPDGGGFTLHFTKPLAADTHVSPKTIRVRRWYYPYGIRYGSPRHEEVDVSVQKATVSSDRKSIELTLPIKTYKNCMVYYFHVGKLESADGEPAQNPEAWYTVQRAWK